MDPHSIPASKRLNDFLKKSIVPELKKLGFAGKGRVLTRTQGDGVQVVDIQNWKYNDPANARFTIEIGVCFPQVLAQVARLDEFSYLLPYVGKPDIATCHVRERLGMFLDAPEDYWWTISAVTGESPEPAPILALLQTRGLPWLDARSTYAGLVALGEAGGGAQGIVILATSGRHEAAIAEVEAYAQRRSARNPDAAPAFREQLLSLVAATGAR
jgi:hypothetical protein